MCLPRWFDDNKPGRGTSGSLGTLALIESPNTRRLALKLAKLDFREKKAVFRRQFTSKYVMLSYIARSNPNHLGISSQRVGSLSRCSMKQALNKLKPETLYMIENN